MTNYMKDTAIVEQNLIDAGCDGDTIKRFMELVKAGKQQGQVRLLEKHRNILLEQVHKNEKQIDCLDYLLYQMQKVNM